MVWVLGSGCEGRTPWHGCWASYGMDAELCCTKRSGTQEHMDAGTSLELGPHRQGAAGALGRHAGGTMKSDPEAPLGPGQ